jgi:hypothetical protein
MALSLGTGSDRLQWKPEDFRCNWLLTSSCSFLTEHQAFSLLVLETPWFSCNALWLCRIIFCMRNRFRLPGIDNACQRRFDCLLGVEDGEVVYNVRRSCFKLLCFGIWLLSPLTVSLRLSLLFLFTICVLYCIALHATHCIPATNIVII